MRLEVLHIPDCPNLSPMLRHLAEATDLPITTRVILNDSAAVAFGMAGSPTLLIDGVDPFPPDDCECGLSCRLYRDEDGQIVPAPSIEQLRDAINSLPAPGDVLSAWRTRALPLDPIERSVQQAILRTFATTGHPPEAADLGPATADGGRSTGEVLKALHEADAIRLTEDGQVAVAYPFSTTPTRHQVRIGSVDVYAMCAIDALGIAPMLNQDTLIEFVDLTTGQPITVTNTRGLTTWEPAGAVVFIGAEAGGGPSADCCCNYLNFFTNQAAAEAWSTAHPQVPGQILNHPEAESLATRLFGHLLAP
ncbi:alkylmercury lyase family protein [Kribbella catacumbae]|uniref:alkylmercury lyase family protein n=1 Tax=Kribbella catacumbae TaxID=460086 RepID=UPI0003745F2C|nr:alkylmercury lyase family protein [Kribbella catacumbae]